jgi:hypothetical protein
MILQQNMNSVKTEPDSDSEMYLEYSHNANELIDVKEEGDPVPIKFSVMEVKIEVSCVFVCVGVPM